MPSAFISSIVNSSSGDDPRKPSKKSSAKNAEPEPYAEKRVLATRNNDGWRSTYMPSLSQEIETPEGGKKTVTIPGHWTMPDQHNIQTRNVASPIVDMFNGYITSPLYKQRLANFNVQNPDQLIKGRLSALKGAEFFSNAADNGSTFYDGKGVLQVQADNTKPSIVAHETAHGFNVNNGSSKPAGNVAQVGSMSPYEAWFMINRSNVKPELKKRAVDFYNSSAKMGSYTADPVAGVMSGGDDHEVSTSEWKSDLDSIRYLLKKHGYTKQFGDNINEELLQRAAKDPNVGGDSHFKRLLKSFTPKNLAEINNKIAYQGKGSGGDIA